MATNIDLSATIEYNIVCTLKEALFALAGVAQWIERGPVKVASSITSQGTCLGCGPGPQ